MLVGEEEEEGVVDAHPAPALDQLGEDSPTIAGPLRRRRAHGIDASL
jgi:hypothetical protein